MQLDITQIENEFGTIQPIVDQLVEKYCGHLNKTIDEYKSFVENNKEFSDKDLEDFSLKISSQMYYVGSAQEILGLKETISALVLQKKYNEIFLKATGTIKDKEASSAKETQQEKMINKIYYCVEKTMEHNLQYASEILRAIRLVIKKRTVEQEMEKFSLIKTKVGPSAQD